MQRAGMVLLLLLGAADAANAETCLDRINEAVTLADALPPSAGRAAVLTDIARARDSRHEGAEADCLEQIDETLALLREHREARSQPAAGQSDHKAD